MPARRTDTFLATGVVVVFSLATAAAAGAIPHHRSAAPAVVVQQRGHQHLAQHHRAHPRAHPVTAIVMPPTVRRHHVTHRLTTAPTTAPTSAPTPVAAVVATSAAPSAPTHHAVPTHHATATHHHPSASPTHSSKPRPKPKPSTPAHAARTTPTAGQIQSALQGLKNFVHTLLSPTASEVADFGDQVCTAFDNDETATHIKSVILNKVQSLPLTTILPGAADYVVRTAVKLYCPGYKSRLSS